MTHVPDQWLLLRVDAQATTPVTEPRPRKQSRVTFVTDRTFVVSRAARALSERKRNEMDM